MYPYPLLMDPPAPTWPQYQSLLDEARRTVPSFADPANLYPAAEVVQRRGHDWATAILGYPFEGFRGVSRVQHQLLQLADQADLDPPLPAWIVEGRAEGERHRVSLDQARRDQAARDAARWAEARDASPVDLEVRESSRTRARGGINQHLGHAVPGVDVYSGTRRVRVHAAGRALCETPTRAKPLQLGEATTGPATCVSCLQWATQIRSTKETQPNA